jgi:hypothetical protein
LQTNDPRRPLLKVTVKANVKPLPETVKRIQNAALERGEQVGNFIVWPTSKPVITVDRGEPSVVAVRIRPATTAASGSLKLARESADYQFKRETNGTGYWLEIRVPPTDETAPRTITVPLDTGDSAAGALAVQLTVNVAAESLIVAPRQIALGEVSRQGGASGAGRLSLRKLVGAFHIKSLSASLDFLELESQTMVEGSNYLIRISVDLTKLPKAGAYTGLLRIETDDRNTPRVEVPVKLVVVDK